MLPALFTVPFAAAYDALPERDVPRIDEMLDLLELEHDSAEMRGQIRVGQTLLFTTPRIYARDGVYRITWQYDDRAAPTQIVCISVASVET